MVKCYDCNLNFKSRIVDNDIEVYDKKNHCWTDSCPNCGSYDFYDEDRDDEKEEYLDDDEFDS